MDWNDKLQRIIDNVEDCLQRKGTSVDKEKIAQMAGCSYSFFQKVFSYMNGVSFAEYIRNRKMTLAGYDLKSTSIKIIDLSYKYGYESPTSFTKAFQQFHGISPTAARAAGTNLRVYPKMVIAAKHKYAWRIEKKAAFRLIGKSVKISRREQQHFKKIPEFWDTCHRDGVFSALIKMDQASVKGMMGLFSRYDEAVDEVEYSIMVESALPAFCEFTQLVIPKMTWAVFDCIGPVPKAIQNGWRFLQQEWLIQYPFQHADCPEIEWYSSGNSYAEDYLSQIWIPILEEDY